ncbi:MAG: acyltransferase [Rhodocyclaceae bacterium]
MKRTGSHQHWADAAEAGSALGLWILFWVHRLFGRIPFRIAVYPVIAYYFCVRRVARQASMQYLERLHTATGALTGPPTWRLSLRHFLSFAETILDKLLAMNGRLDDCTLEIVGRDQLQQLITAQRGAVVVASHLGNLELCRALGELTDRVPLTILVHVAHSAHFNRVLNRVNTGGRVTLLPVTEIGPGTVADLSARVARGELIVMAGDRMPISATPRVVSASFLGHAAPFPIGPYVMASLLQCETYLMFCTRRPGRVYRVDFEPFRSHIALPRKGRDDALAALAQDYADRLGAHCAAAPLEWFNFYPFWNFPHTYEQAPAVQP